MTPLDSYIKKMWDSKEITHDDKKLIIRYDETERTKSTTVTVERDGYLYHVVADHGFDMSIAAFLLYFDKLHQANVEDDFVSVMDADYPPHSSFDQITIFPPKGGRLMYMDELQKISFWVIPSHNTEHWNRMSFKDFDFQFWRKDGQAINFLDWNRRAP